MSLGEVIAWGPLGPGGDPAMSLQGDRGAAMLGRLSAKRENYRVLRGTRSTRLGEAIRWAPLGPGGDPQMSVQGLSGVAPATQQLVATAMGQLETTDLQVYNELADAVTWDVDVTQEEFEYDALLDRFIELQTASQSLDEADWPAFNERAGALQVDYDAMLRKLQAARERRRTGGQYMALAWGVGISAAAAGLLWAVWRNRGKRKR